MMRGEESCHDIHGLLCILIVHTTLRHRVLAECVVLHYPAYITPYYCTEICCTALNDTHLKHSLVHYSNLRCFNLHDSLSYTFNLSLPPSFLPSSPYTHTLILFSSPSSTSSHTHILNPHPLRTSLHARTHSHTHSPLTNTHTHTHSSFSLSSSPHPTTLLLLLTISLSLHLPPSLPPLYSPSTSLPSPLSALHPHFPTLFPPLPTPDTHSLFSTHPSTRTHSRINLFLLTGTTGNPKGVELSHTNLMSNIQGINQRMRVSTIPQHSVMYTSVIHSA